MKVRVMGERERFLGSQSRRDQDPSVQMCWETHEKHKWRRWRTTKYRSGKWDELTGNRAVRRKMARKREGRRGDIWCVSMCVLPSYAVCTYYALTCVVRELRQGSLVSSRTRPSWTYWKWQSRPLLLLLLLLLFNGELQPGGTLSPTFDV